MTQAEHTQPNVCRVEDAPKFIKLLIKSIGRMTIGCQYVAWSGSLDQGIRLGTGWSAEKALESYNTTSVCHILGTYQEGNPIVEWGADVVSVKYSQEGLRSDDKFYGFSYDAYDMYIVQYPKGPITLIQLNELVQTLNKVADELMTNEVELLHQELGTPPHERIGHIWVSTTNTVFGECNEAECDGDIVIDDDDDKSFEGLIELDGEGILDGIDS